MRFAYLDESGIGDPRREPHVVVAGVIVHADLQLKSIEKYLFDMIEDCVRPEDRANFTFHAKELYNGGRILRREVYPKNFRHKVLRELCEIPAKFDLPVVMGSVEKAHLQGNYTQSKPRDIAIAAQAMASTACLISIERYMRRAEQANEVAALVYENNEQAKRLIRSTHNFLRKPSAALSREGDDEWNKYIPLQRIAETAFFAEKTESSIIQVADAIAFAINKKWRKTDDCDYFFGPVDGQLIVRPRAFL